MNENQYGNFTGGTKFVKFSYWFFGNLQKL